MKRLLELAFCECRWPVHEDGEGHLFCGQRVTKGSSYCETHRQMSVEPEPPDWWLEVGEWLGVKR